MTINTTIGSRGTALSCATPLAATAGWGAGTYWAVEAGVPGVRLVHLRGRVEGTRLFTNPAMPTNADLTSAKQAPIHVPQPPSERSP